MAQRKAAAIFSIFICVASFIILAINGLNFGLDFTGGTQVEVSYQQPIDFNKVREEIKEAGFGDPFEEERLKEKLEEYNKSKSIEQQKDQNPKGEGIPSMQNHLITTQFLS